MRKLTCIFFALVMSLALVLASCGQAASGQESGSTTASAASTESAKLTDGIYEETTIGMKTYYRFNEDGTYYAYFFDGGVIEAGTYEVQDKETEYREEGDDDTKAATLTAPQTIVTTSYQGNVTEIAYADDTLQDCNLGGMAGYRFLHHNAEYAYDAANEETPLAVYTFYADNKSGNSLTLYHDKTFIDYTGDVGKEGTWTKDSDFLYTLTDEDNNTMTLALDGHNATYGDKTLADSIVNQGEAQVINTYRVDETEVGLPMPVAVRIDCYDNATAKMVVEIAQIGSELELDKGTYELDSLVYTPTFHFEKLGDIVSTPDYDHATVDGIPASVAVQGTVTAVDESGTETEMALDCTLEGTAGADKVPTSTADAASAEATVLTSFTAENAETGLPMPVEFYIDLMDDNTCVAGIYVEMLDQRVPLDQGTYTVDEAYAYHMTFEQAGEVEGEPDYATATATGLTINANYKLKMDLPQEDGSVIPLDIDLTASGPAYAG